MNNRTRLFTRLDAQGNRIPGSSVKRKTSPKVGRWVEETVNTCCAPYTALTATPNNATSDTYTLVVLCSAVAALTLVLNLTAAVTDIDDLTLKLNENLGYLGAFSNDGTEVTLKLVQEIADSLCADSANLTMTLTGS